MDYISVKRKRKLIFIEKENNKKNKQKIIINKSIEELHGEKINYFKQLNTVVLNEKKDKLKKETNQRTKEFLQKEIEDIENKIEESFYFCKVYDIIKNYNYTQDQKIKEDLTKQYYIVNSLTYIEDHHNKISEENWYKCKKCNGDIINDDEEEIICQECGLVNDKNISTIPTYNELSSGSYTLTKKVIYKRESYFIELLKNIQNSKINDFPEDLIKNIKNQLYINNITESKDLSYSLIKGILKKLNYSKYYDNIQSIICIINKEKPLNIPQPVEKILLHMFKVIQTPWEKCKNSERHSFFSYPYVLYKFFQILDLDEYLQYLTLLKSREKLIKHEILWKEIMEYIIDNNIDNKFYFKINWRYIPLI